jgi:hypothetical protein
MVWRQMRDQHESHPGVARQMRQQPREGVQTTGGSSDPNYRKAVRFRTLWRCAHLVSKH